MEDDQQADISLSESFGRARRNSLVFSSILLLVALSQSDGRISLSPLGGTLNIDAKVLLVLLAVSSMFFLAGYYRAYAMTKRRNSEALVGEADNEVEARETFLQEVQEYQTTVKQACAARLAIRNLANEFTMPSDLRHELYKKTMPQTIQWLRYPPEKNKETDLKDIDRIYMVLKTEVVEYHNGIEDFVQNIERAVDEWKDKIVFESLKDERLSDDDNQTLHRIEELMKRREAQLNTLSSKIRVGSRRWFLIYDHGLTVALFAFALIASIVRFFVLFLAAPEPVVPTMLYVVFPFLQPFK